MSSDSSCPFSNGRSVTSRRDVLTATTVLAAAAAAPAGAAAASSAAASGGAIQRKYQTDEKFRSYVMRYLKEYSALVKHARATDRSEVLTTTFSTSDMGKLYMLLNKAMDAAATVDSPEAP